MHCKYITANWVSHAGESLHSVFPKSSRFPIFALPVGRVGNSARSRYTTSLPELLDDHRTETMTKRTFVDVKTALAEKYERLSRLTSSVPKKSTFAHLALKYRRQAAQAARDGIT